jgi:predicted RNA binding protein YcfA (HicA-like mRNA interferase family)
MASSRKVLDAILRGQGVIAFRDLERLLGQMGFSLARVSGSHHIYVHPKATRPVNIQRSGKDAKPYQIRQIRDMIVEFGLSLED